MGIADHLRLLFATHLCLALLAGRGLDVPDELRVRRVSVAAATGLALALGFLWVGGWCRGGSTVIGTPSVLTQPAVSLGATCLLIAAFQRRPGLRIWCWLTAALLLADACAAHGPRLHIARAGFPPTPPALEVVRGSPELGRAFIARGLMPANAGMVYRTATIAVYEPTTSRRMTELLTLAGLSRFLELPHTAPPSQIRRHCASWTF